MYGERWFAFAHLRHVEGGGKVIGAPRKDSFVRALSLLAWLDAPYSSREVAFADPDGWNQVYYPAPAGRVARPAVGFRERGVRPDDVANVVLFNGPELIEPILARLVAGRGAAALRMIRDKPRCRAMWDRCASVTFGVPGPPDLGSAVETRAA